MARQLKQTDKISGRRGAAAIEYAGLVIAVLMAIVFFQDYIVRGLSGKWKLAGDGISSGRQYDPRPFGAKGEGGGTHVCYYEERVGNWVDREAVEANCDCTLPPEDPEYATECMGCLGLYTSTWCTDSTNF